MSTQADKIETHECALCDGKCSFPYDEFCEFDYATDSESDYADDVYNDDGPEY